MPVATLTAAPAADNEVIKRREAARYLSIGETKLWSLTQGGHIPVVRIGRAVRYRRADLDAFIASHTVGGDAST